jgi:hypothetical protein
MGINFRKSIKINKHNKINVGKKGISMTTGVPGFHITKNKSGISVTIGLPGTGLSYTKKIKK